MEDFISPENGHATAIFDVREPEKPPNKGKIFGDATLKLALGQGLPTFFEVEGYLMSVESHKGHTICLLQTS